MVLALPSGEICQMSQDAVPTIMFPVLPTASDRASGGGAPASVPVCPKGMLLELTPRSPAAVT